MARFRPFIQILFLGAFMVLMVLGKAQIWMGFIFLSIILSAFFGRYYCGWACPINTLIRSINWLGKKLGTQKKQVPGVFKSEKIRWGVFTLFLVGLAYTIYTISIGKKFPLPLIIIPLGLLTTLCINENTWHRYLCPWGVLFSLTGRFAKLGITASSCYGCGICEKDCPGDAITVKDKKAEVDATHCLLCFECHSVCPKDAMSYEKKPDKKSVKA
jgi:polyferredoxin